MAMSPEPLRIAREVPGLCVWPLARVRVAVAKPPPPPTGSAEFEAAKKDYQEMRRKEHGFSSFEPPAKKKQAKK